MNIIISANNCLLCTTGKTLMNIFQFALAEKYISYFVFFFGSFLRG